MTTRTYLTCSECGTGAYRVSAHDDELFLCTTAGCDHGIRPADIVIDAWEETWDVDPNGYVYTEPMTED